jgi:uncharacterized protein YjeT (DUF2065 family)
MMLDLVAGLGIALVLEGLLWALAPDTARRMVLELSGLDPERLRPVAWGAVAAGCFLVWLVRG